MKSTELMIGDWMDWPKSPFANPHFYSQVVALERGEMSPCIGIPLTPEILEKNGGKNNHIQPNDDWDIEYRYSAEGGMFIKVTEVGDELTPSWMIFAKELNYVHQFQHLLRLCGLNDLADNFII